ncbi:adenylyltransferase/cytidyltransferase family protein [Alteromonas halophila]|uniref:Glycerol-3-phosphate cytidylyltransferase n=1 Tax=Alteromonas halophila TaxID=516698 RepID=A0A918JPN6_9ALTE|nr:adenylyltransferase/cytidyltransferase family protein [Alteromonas halophila]GGW92620.1 glycerol-3-phosphate cytidylyltransferase [Alteromonas halophila]
MRTVVTYGTFDLFHIGHVRLLRRLKALGDRLVVGLSTDEFNKVKGKEIVIPFEDRKEILLSCRYVDDVFEENSWEQKRADLIREKASTFAIGDDWAGKFDDLEDIVQVLYLPRTKDISTTELKTVLSTITDDKLQEIKNVASHLVSLTESLK